MNPPAFAHAFGRFLREQAVIVLLLIMVAALGGLSVHLAAQRAEVRAELALAEATNADANQTIKQLQARIDQLTLDAELAAAALEETRAQQERSETTLARLSTSSDERIAKLLSMARRPGANCQAPQELLRELKGL